MQVIFGNYGNNTIALIQWAHEHKKKNIYVAHVETGFAAIEWKVQVKKGQALVKRYHFKAVSLRANPNLPEMILDRQRFPSRQFQWCVSFLKGLPFLQWLEQVDPSYEAEIWLPSRKEDSRVRVNLPNVIEQSERYGGRKVLYPINEIENDERNRLIAEAGLDYFTHRSLECDPCIHSQIADFQRLDEEAVSRVMHLESHLRRSMFKAENFGGNEGIRAIVNWAKLQTTPFESHLEQYDMGCGSAYACGE